MDKKYIIDEIHDLKMKKHAIILAHNYQAPEVQDIADFVGDSLELAKKCVNIVEENIVFCGVYFMAETAKILNPNKNVYLPRIDAGCPLAEMITADEILRLKQKYPNAIVVCYVNSTAEVKAVSDVACTSGNARRLVEALPGNEIIFVPDKNLGGYIAENTNKEIILVDGYCPTHENVPVKEILAVKEKYPTALLIVHPECNKEMRDLADAVESTSGMLKFVENSDANEFIVGTEVGMIYRLEKENPNKKFYLASNKLFCPNMKKTRLTDILDVLKNDKNKILVDENISRQALRSINKMLEY